MSKTQKVEAEQLTAFVMGELGGAERAAVEAAVAADPVLGAEVEELRRFCGQLWNELRDEPAPSMSAAEQAAFLRRLDEVPAGASRALTKRRFLWASIIPLAAAALALFVVYPKLAQPKLDDVREVVTGRPSTNAAEEIRFEAAPQETPVQEATLARDGAPAPSVAADAKRLQADPPAAVAAKPSKAEQPSSPSSRSADGVDLRQLGHGVSSGLAENKKSDKSFGFASGGPGIGAKGKTSSLAGAPRGRLDDSEADSLGHGGLETEAYDFIGENPFHAPTSEPLSTFSVDVDTASYANVRRYIKSGTLPPKDAVRIEEMLNYFRYDYPKPEGDRPFSVAVEVTAAPWKTGHRLVRIGLKGKDIAWNERPTSNLVFLIDVSGSMNAPNKLPLVKQALKLLVDQFGDQDRVAIVVYAGSSGLVLPSTSGADKQAIMDALERLEAGGSTNGGEGLALAYATAEKHFVKGGVNRVVIATDGDFNVGTTSPGDLVRLIETKAKSGVFLSVLGFGMGNYKDSTLEKLADKGNGNYGYIDSVAEAKKALVEEVGGTLVTIAKDVKLQVEFNPAQVTAYRLIGYENRVLAHQDFSNDLKDAGDIGAGHVVTALYEVVPRGVPFKVNGIDALKYQTPQSADAQGSGEIMTLKLRYKLPEAAKSNLIEYVVKDKGEALADASVDTRFAAGVAAFGMVLRDSEHKGDATYDLALGLLADGARQDPGGYRKELVELVKKAKSIGRR